MKNKPDLSETWLKASIIGTTWAASEIVLGSFLHNLRIPFSGNILTGIGLIILISASYKWKNRGLFWRAGLICALMKSISPSAVIFGPMIAILTESLLLELSTRILGKSAIGFLVGSALAMSWVLVQRIFNFILFYGFNIVEIYTNMMKFAENQLGLSFNILWLPIVFLFSLDVLFGFATALLGMRAGKQLIKQPFSFTSQTTRQDTVADKREKSDDFTYSLLWLIGDLILIIGALFILNYTSWFIWSTSIVVIIAIWAFRYNPSSNSYWKTNPKVKEQVTSFRVDKVKELHDDFLSEISIFAKSKSGFDIIVTFYDTYFSPELMEYYGASSDNMIELRKKYKFHLQPEDPLNKWSTDPDRYVEMGKVYSGKMKDPSDLMLDLNIFKFRARNDVSPFSTLIQTGLESYQLIKAASAFSRRFTIYSESSCNAQDIPYFTNASSGMVQYKCLDDGYRVYSPHSFELHLPGSIKVIRVDGVNQTGYRDNHYLIPAGDHIIITHFNEIPGFSTHELQPQLLFISGNLLKVEYLMQTILFSYESDERTLASLNYIPTSIKLDGQQYVTEVLEGNDCYTIMLPSGNHQVEILKGDKFSYGINLASIWSMSAISIWGVLAVVLLANLFIALKFIRRHYKF
jgi:hypothetical protein